MYITAMDVVMRNLAPRVKCPVVSEVPERPPALFIRIDQGSPKEESPVTDQNLVFIQVYGDDLETVLETCDTAQTILATMDTWDWDVAGFEFTEKAHDYPDPDERDDHRHRWQIAGSLTYYTA